MQTRLCCWLEASCRHPERQTTFLSLPQELRFRIFEAAGVLTGGYVDISKLKRHGLRLCKSTEADYEAIELYHTLRLVSSKVDADVAHFICQENTVLFMHYGSVQMGHFLEIPDVLMSSFRRIQIHLNVPESRVAGCFYHRSRLHLRWDAAHCFKCYLGYVYRGRPGGFAGAEARVAWSVIVSRLTSLSKLELLLVSDVKNEAAAWEVVKPMEKLRLTACTIRLKAGRAPALEAIARWGVHQSTKSTIRRLAGSFDFMGLPTELRQYILSFTDLVVPYGRVSWDLRRKFTSSYTYCTSTRCRKRAEFCTEYAAVYPNCGHWKVPTPLFLVSKVMLHDVRAVFWSSNCFNVLSLDDTILVRFEASYFFTKVIPRSCLSYLRELEINFPARQYDFFGNIVERSFCLDWARTVEQTAPYLRTLKLQIKVDVYSRIRHPGWNLRDDGLALLRTQEQMIKPLALWRDMLKSLHITTHSPKRLWRMIRRQEHEYHEHLRNLIENGYFERTMTVPIEGIEEEARLSGS